MLHQDCWLIVKETQLSVDFYGESVIRDNLIPRKIPPPLKLKFYQTDLCEENDKRKISNYAKPMGEK